MKVSIFAAIVLLLSGSHVYSQTDEVNAFYWADTVTVEGQKHFQIPTLNTIATKMLIPLHKTPASVGVVSRTVFERQLGVTLRDALRNVSGVNVQNGFGTHDFFLMRGFESLSGGLVLTDGAAEPEVSFYNLYNIERVEVLKGPAAFLYGGNPLSGAANLVRKQPLFENFASFSGSYGEFQSFRGTFDAGLTNPEQNLAMRINGLWQDSEDYRDDKDNNSYAINPALAWRMDENSAVTANFEYVKSNYQPDSGIPLLFSFNERFQPVVLGLPDVPRERSYQSPLDDSEQDLLRLRLDYHHRVNNHLQLRDKFYFTRMEWKSRGTLINGAFPDFQQQGAFNVVRLLNQLDDNQRFTGNQLEAHWTFRTATVKHQLLTGLETARFADKFDLRFGQIADIDLFTPVETVTAPDQLLLAPFAAGDGRSLVFAPYFLDQVALTTNVQLFAGGRFDYINYRDTRTDFDFVNQFPVASKTDRSYQRFSPMAGLIIEPSASLSIYANAGQAFRPPSVTVPGDPKPEESTQFEVGAKLRTLGGRLTSSLALYHLKKENITILDQTGVSRQNGDQRSRGLEFELAAQWQRGLHTYFTYSFTDAELTQFQEFDNLTQQIADRNGNTPAFVPDHILNFWATKEYGNGLGFGGGLRFVSSQYIDEDNAFQIDDYLTFDATIFYSLTPWRWSINVKNITDRDYETRGFNQFSVTPARPRAVYAAIDFAL